MNKDITHREKDGRWKKGYVVHRRGGTKREWSWAGLIETAMEEESQTGIPYKVLVVRKLRDLAIKGDLNAIKEVIVRMDGLPVPQIDPAADDKRLLVIDIRTDERIKNLSVNQSPAETDGSAGDASQPEM